MTTRLLMLISLVLLCLLACSPDPKSEHGFRLPDGNAEAGKTAFAWLQCVDCHSVEGAEFPQDAEGRAMDVHLGGKVLRVRTYGELVTAIINPSHDLAKGVDPEAVSVGGKSMMADYNLTMTVQQMIDLVAFLQSTYREHLPQDYDPYFP